MMEVEKPWEFKEDVEIMEEDTGGGLQTRERKKRLDHGHGHGHGNGNGGEEEFNTGEDEAQVLEEHNSVFFDPTKVADHVTEVSGKNGVTEVMRFSAQKEEANETSSPKGKELGTQENVNAQEANHNSNNSKLENGSRSNVSHEDSNCSETMTIANGKAGLKLIATIDDIKNSVVNSNGSLDISNGSMSRTNVHEIEVEKDEHVTQGKVNIEEYDLEKILDEQETHDLYCPNCNSCITRRVILRKRKRTVRQIIRDEPPKKPQLAEPSANASNQSERHEQGSHDIFRCLSCFAFFIPTGCGFNIFRIFGRTEVNQEVQVQHPSASRDMSDNCGSWLLSCFQSGDSPKKADVDSAKKPLLSDTQSSNHATTSAEASTSPAHSHGTTGKPEESKKPLLDESSSELKTTTTKTEEEFKPSHGEFHGTAVSTEASHTSFASSKISSGKSETGLVQTEITHVVTGQQDVVIPLPKPAGEAVTDTTHLDGKEDVQESTMATSENDSFFSQAIPTSEVKVESPSETKIVPEGIIPMGGKPTSLIPQVQAVGPAASPHLVLPIPDAVTTGTPRDPRSEQRDEWDILKAIVYGGLVESITSLSVVSAAAASGAKTLDIFILGIANLIGGLPLIFHNITDLRNLGDVDENDEQVGHYWLQLGRRSRFRLHMVMAILSYILFGLLPPVIYGLSFRKSDNRENKMVAVAAASLACIALLAIGKAHVKRPRTYIKTLMYYLTIGVSASGLSYVAGVLITRLLAHFGLIDQGASAPASPSLLFPDAVDASASY